MAFENIPTPEELVKNHYNMSSGDCIDCTAEQRAHRGYQQLWLPLITMNKDVLPIDGVPQVQYINFFGEANGFPDNLTHIACFDRANQLALDNPAWAKKAGQDGLIKIALVCMWESEGRIPDGYMQQFVTALGKKSTPIPKWVWIGGAAAAAFLLLRK